MMGILRDELPIVRSKLSHSAIRSPRATASIARAHFRSSLEKRSKRKGIAVEIENAGVSGDTASGGLSRLDWSVGDGTDAVILELGANDMLRGVDPKVTRKALETIIERLKARNIEVLLAGMRARAEYGRGLSARLRGDLSGTRRQIRARLLPVLPRRRRDTGEIRAAGRDCIRMPQACHKSLPESRQKSRN